MPNKRGGGGQKKGGWTSLLNLINEGGASVGISTYVLISVMYEKRDKMFHNIDAQS